MPQEAQTQPELGVIRIQVALHTFTTQQLRLILTHSMIGSCKINKRMHLHMQTHTHLVTIKGCCYLIEELSYLGIDVDIRLRPED